MSLSVLKHGMHQIGFEINDKIIGALHIYKKNNKYQM